MRPFTPTHVSHKRVEAYPLQELRLEPDGQLVAYVEVPGAIIPVEVPESIIARGRPQPGSMLVRYEPTPSEPDGYMAFSPRMPFEAGYAPIDWGRDPTPGVEHGLTFGQAIEAARRDRAIAREGWNGAGMFVVLMPPLYLPPFNTQDTARKVNDRTAKWIGEDQPLDCQPYFAMWTARKQWQPGWLASQADMLATDWAIVGEHRAVAA